MTPREGVEPVWAVVDRHGVVLPNSNEAAELACFYTKDEADEELTYANQGEGAPPWESRKPFEVTALYAHPAATAREEAWKALLAYAECEQSFEAPTTEAMCATLARHGWVEGTPPIRFVMDLRAKALALARSVKDEEA